MWFPCVDGCLQSLTQDAYGFVKKRWLILYHFKKNFADLEGKKEELEKQREKVEEQVERAKEQGEEIKKEVSKWMDGKEIKEVDDLLQQKTEGQSITCFNFSFPNCISRYQLSKSAEKEITALQKKIDGGNFSAVSVPAPPPRELQFPATIVEYKVFESRAAVLNKIKVALKENNVVGIHGAGGVGKTTMAAEVAKQLQREGCIHEVAMAVVSQDPDVKKIQGKLASYLKDFKLDEMENKEERAWKLWNRLENEKSNLVILDDLWGKINLREIGIPVPGGNKDCKLLITSRQPQEVWKDTTWDSELHVKLIPIEQLKDKEAWELFKNHAGDSIESSELRLIASQVCKKCGGLPVAIRAVGKALKDKDLDEWSDALTNLEKSRMERIVGIDEELFPSLKLSYKMLKSEEARKCFLLCCLFPDDAEIPIGDLVMHCRAARFVEEVEEDKMEKTRWRVHTLIKHLKERCLLLDVADEENSVKVHDVIRDVGVSISKEGNESLQLMHGFQDIRGGGEGASSNRRSPYIAMWLRKFHFEDDRVCPDAGTLVLQWNGSSIEDDHALVRRANNFLSREDLSLKVLVLYGLSISSLFPSSCESLANLRMLWLDTWKEDDKNILVHVGKLEVLRISAAKFVELPTEVGLLTGLLVLDLRNARGMKKIPYGVLSKLTRLEELYLPTRPQKIIEWENGEDKRGGSELNCLKRLTTLWTCSRDSDFFNGLFLDKLKRFHICVNTVTSPFSGHHFTKVLEVSQVSLTPELRGLMGRAEKIRIKCLFGSSEVINHGGIPYNLKELEIEKSRDLKCVVGEAEGLRAPLGQVGLFESLTKLYIDGCQGLEYIFSEPCARSLRQLRRLEVKHCLSLVSIIREVEEEILEQHQEDVICFDRLETLVLEYLPCFVGFYSRPDGERSVLFSDKIGCPSLSSLTIIYLPTINEIWGKQSVKRVLKSLVSVDIRGCRDLETIISEKWKENQQNADGDIALVFPLLRRAFLYGNNNFKSFYFNKFSMEGEPFFNSQVSCPALEELRISKGAAKIVWDEQSYKNFPNLKLLKLLYCSKIEVIVSNQGGANGDVLTFPQLRELKLLGLQSVKSFYTVRSLPEEESFFNHQVECPVLEVLTIDGLSKIKKIWDEQSYKNFPNLKDLSIKDCHEIESIVSNQGKGNRVEANGDVLTFPQLRKLQLLSLGSVKSFYTVRSLPEEESFFNHQVECPVLEVLTIDGLSKIKKIWDEQSYKNFPNLKDLSIKDCHEIESIVSNQGKGNRVEANGDVLTFPQLRKLQLLSLGSVKSFYTVRSLPEEESFFNHQVECPVLEVLTIDGLSKIKKIWDEQSYKNFPNLKDLSIEDCHEIESIVSNQGKGNRVEANGDVLTFPQLRKLQLLSLGSVKSFYTVRSLPEEESFFNHQVECPVLEVLTINGLSKIKKIWDEQSYKNFPNLKDLSIEDCHEIESIVSNQGKGNRVEANGDVLTFPQLRKLQLLSLGSVKSFYTVRSLPEEESFFNHQVECPVLEVLTIDGLSKIKKIWDEQSYKNFPNLKDLSIEDCHEIESIVSNQGKGNRVEANGDVLTFPQLRKLQLQRLGSVKSFYIVRSLPEEESFFNHQVECPVLEVLTIDGLSKIKKIWDEQSYKNFPNLEDLSIEDCHEIESIVSNQGKGNRVEANGDVLTFPQLRKLQLQTLESVKSFYTVRSLPEEESFFNHQVECPVLEYLRIYGLSKIKKIWDEQSYKKFPNLKDLSIKCCPEIESIVSNQGKGNREEATGDVVIFPQLWVLRLEQLRNIKCFYTLRSLPNQESFFKHQIIYPALERCEFLYIPKAKEVYEVKILPQLGSSQLKEICGQENKSQGVLLPKLRELGFEKEVIWGTRLNTVTDWIDFYNCDKRLFQPLFDAFFGLGRE